MKPGENWFMWAGCEELRQHISTRKQFFISLNTPDISNKMYEIDLLLTLFSLFASLFFSCFKILIIYSILPLSSKSSFTVLFQQKYLAPPVILQWSRFLPFPPANYCHLCFSIYFTCSRTSVSSPFSSPTFPLSWHCDINFNFNFFWSSQPSSNGNGIFHVIVSLHWIIRYLFQRKT